VPAPRTLALDDAQRAVVDHDGGPLRVLGGFGTGKSAAHAARAARLRAAGRRPRLVHHRDLVDLAIAILGRHGRPRTHLHRLRPVVLDVLGDDLRLPVDEVAAAVVAFQSSFLGDEELRVHADAAGCLDVAEELIAVTARYLAVLDRRGLVDEGGALVQASLLLRDPGVLAAEQARFDELLVDDFQLASFATARLVTQLVGPGGPVVVAGHAEAAVSPDPLASGVHLERFDRRFGATTVELPTVHRRPAGAPELRLLDDERPVRGAAVAALREATGGSGTGIVVHREGMAEFVGHEAEVVVVEDACDHRWPSPRPIPTWFDPELLHGPDVPDDDDRDRRWEALERRRFRVATTRATARLIVLAPLPVTRFVDGLVQP
jgi:superfamily I DNA/RNA helicase